MSIPEAVDCFVIGPIGDRNAPLGTPDRQRYEDALQVFDQVITPACENNGLEPVRADLISTPGEITEQVFKHLRDDYVVVADLTDANPNVMYELGLRHTRDKLTVSIGETGRLPFDVGVIRAVPFVRSEYGLIEARERLQEMLEAGLSTGWDRVTATRLWNERDGETPTSDTDASEQPGEEPGFLELLAEMEEAQPKMLTHLGRISEIMSQMGELATESTPKMANATSAGAKLLIANQYADALTPLAEALETEAGLYTDAVKQVDPGVTHLLNVLEADADQRETPEGQGFLSNLMGMGNAARESGPKTIEFAQSVVGLASASRKLREPTSRVDRALRRVAEGVSTSGAWGDRAREIVEQMGEAKATD